MSQGRGFDEGRGSGWQVPRDHFLAQQGKATGAGAHDSTSTAEASRVSPPPLVTATASSSSSSSSPPPPAIPDTSTLAGADFDVDVRSGFLPPEPPLRRIPDEMPEAVWEHALDAARQVKLKLAGSGVDEAQRALHRTWRRAIRNMPVVWESSSTMQTDIRFARRGHVVLTFLAHYYVHSQPAPRGAGATPSSQPSSSRWWAKSKALDEDALDSAAESSGTFAARLPPSIATPLLRLSSQLDIPPVLTYADTVLWNWRLADPSLGITPTNLRICETFSDTPSEEHFFLTSLLIELRGVAALDVMRVCLDECFMGDALAKRRVAKYLDHLCAIVKDLEQLLRDVRLHCDPAVFYWGIRPWFRGGDSSPFDQKGWRYETSDGSNAPPRIFTGPSAGQSSLIHALDVFLDVDHAKVKPRVNIPRPVNVDGAAAAAASSSRPAPVITADAASLPPDATFMQRMQLYMPGQHRRFLTHLQSLTADEDGDGDEAMDVDATNPTPTPTSSSSSSSAPPPSPLRHLAQSTLAASPAHPLPRAYDAALSALKSLRDEHMRVATLYIISQARRPPPSEYLVEQEQREDGDDDAGAKGTGGTNLVQFLKECRTNTVDALLGGQGQASGV